VKTSEFKRALELVKPGLASREMLEQGTSVVFRDGCVWTFNDSVAVVAPLVIDVTGAVPAEPLYAFLGKLGPESEVNIEQADNELKFSSGRNRAGIRLEPDIKLPIDEEIQEPEEWHPLSEEFVKAVQRVQFSASSSDHLPILTCVHITEGYVETCDEFRLTRVDCVTDIQTSNQEVPLGINIVARHLERLFIYKPVEFGFSGDWLQFRNGEGVTYAVRMVGGDYPDLSGFFGVTGQEFEFPKELEKALDWASVAIDKGIKYEQHVDVELRTGAMVIRGEGPDGWAEETIRMRYNGEPVKFLTHPLFLKEMAKVARRVIVGDEALMINGDGFVHVVSLTKSEGTKK
jgi:DNA polymerase III sliding clamp (beta) subunit (PCNA family)